MQYLGEQDILKKINDLTFWSQEVQGLAQ